MCNSINMDVSSLRSLVSLVVQLQTIIIFAQALSVSNPEVTSRPKSRGGESGQNQNKSCCFNGGQCYLGSFCLCPPGYHGRYCEYETEKSKCGNLPHGSWVKAGCNLCQCSFGRMTCLPRVFDGCDDKPPDDDVNPWDYRDEMVLLARETSTSRYDAMDTDYADYYDNAIGDHSHRSGSTTVHSAGSATWTGILGMVCLMTVNVMTSSSLLRSWNLSAS